MKKKQKKKRVVLTNLRKKEIQECEKLLKGNLKNNEKYAIRIYLKSLTKNGN